MLSGQRKVTARVLPATLRGGRWRTLPKSCSFKCHRASTGASLEVATRYWLNFPARGCTGSWGPAHWLLILTPVSSLNEHCSRRKFFFLNYCQAHGLPTLRPEWNLCLKALLGGILQSCQSSCCLELTLSRALSTHCTQQLQRLRATILPGTHENVSISFQIRRKQTKFKV